MMKEEDTKSFLDGVEDDECILVKVLDKNTKEPVFSFNEGYYRKLPDYPLALINLFVDYILEDLNYEIFHISGNQIMTHEGLFIVTQKRHLNLDEHAYSFSEESKRKL